MSARPRLANDVLVVDVGNTALRAQLFQAATRVGSWSYRYRTPWRRDWNRAVRDIRSSSGPALPVIVSSVAPRRWEAARAALRRAGFRALHAVHWRDPWPFRIDVEMRQTIGSDRLANVAGLMAAGWHTAVAVDIGTAVTVDALHRSRFRGGAILPGLEMQAQALHQFTAALPRVDVPSRVPLIGRDTVTALQSGIRNGSVRAIAGLARDIGRALGERVPIVCTGGGAARFTAAAGRRFRHDPELLFRGLRLLAARRR